MVYNILMSIYFLISCSTCHFLIVPWLLLAKASIFCKMRYIISVSCMCHHLLSVIPSSKSLEYFLVHVFQYLLTYILLIGITIGGANDQVELLNNSWDDCAVTSADALCWLKRWYDIQSYYYLLFCLQALDQYSLQWEKNRVLCTIQLEPWIMWLYRLLWPYSPFLLELENTPWSAQFVVHYAGVLPQCSLSYQTKFYTISLISFCCIVASVTSWSLCILENTMTGRF